MPKLPALPEKYRRADALLAAAVAVSAGATALLAACGGTTSGPQSSELPDNAIPVTVPSTRTTLPTTRITIPGTTITVPGTTIYVPGTTIVTPLSRIVVPATRIVVPGTRITVPGTRITVPSSGVTVPGTRIVIPATRIRTPTTVINVPGTTIVVPATRVRVPTGGLGTTGSLTLPSSTTLALVGSGTSGLSASALAATTAKAASASKVYDAALTNPATGSKVGFTVFEPVGLASGQTYPLVLQMNGYGGGRTRALSSANPGLVEQLVASGYGVISVSPRGSDDSTGSARLMDPARDGQDLLAVLDWAEANLGWLKYGPGVDGSARNPVVGAVGASTGGLAALAVNATDAKHRLDAIVPAYAPNDLATALLPNQVFRAAWTSLLFGPGNAAMSRGKAALDPALGSYFLTGLTAGKAADAGAALHALSPAARCGSALPATPALLVQGVRDTLFNASEGLANYQCLKATGADVRLLTTQAGHNTLGAVADPGAAAQPVGNAQDLRCGRVTVASATLAFFDEHLKGVSGAADKVVPAQTCLSLASGDAVLLDRVTAGRAGRLASVPPTLVTAGGTDTPQVIDLGLTATANDALAGVPHLDLVLSKPAGLTTGEPVLLVGLGQVRKNGSGAPELIDNQLTPIRGTGPVSIDLALMGARLAAGDKVVLLVYGQNPQFRAVGSLPSALPAVLPVALQGKAWVPLLGQLPNAATAG